MSRTLSTVIEALRSLPLRIGRVLPVAVSVVACARAAPPPVAEIAAPRTPPVPPSASAPSSSTPAWFENDYPAALRAARARSVPLFVDASAVWCHTCLAMRAFVLDEPALEKSAYVWLSFDVERPGNQAV